MDELKVDIQTVRTEAAAQKAKAEAALAEAAAAKSASNKSTTAEKELAEIQAQLNAATKEIERINETKAKDISDAVTKESLKQSKTILDLSKRLIDIEKYKETMKKNIVTIANIINKSSITPKIDTDNARSVVAILHDIYNSVVSKDLAYVFGVAPPPSWTGPTTLGGYLPEISRKSITRKSRQKKTKYTLRKNKT